MYSLDSYFSNKTLKWKTLSVFIQDWQGSKIIDAEWRVSNIVPIVTVEDGSCLYKAISMILTCNCQLKYELRLKTVKELNWNVYDNEELNLYSTWDNFEKEVLGNAKTGTYSSLTHMYSLSNLLGCTIQ